MYLWVLICISLMITNSEHFFTYFGLSLSCLWQEFIHVCCSSFSCIVFVLGRIFAKIPGVLWLLATACACSPCTLWLCVYVAAVNLMQFHVIGFAFPVSALVATTKVISKTNIKDLFLHVYFLWFFSFRFYV